MTINSDQEFDEAVGRLTTAWTFAGSGVARLAMDCIEYQERLIHSLRESIEQAADRKRAREGGKVCTCSAYETPHFHAVERDELRRGEAPDSDTR